MKVWIGVVGAAMAGLLVGCTGGETSGDTSGKPGGDGKSAAKPPLTKLVIQDVKVGDGDVVEKGDTAEVIYTGKLADGTVFDTNVGKDLFPFPVGASQVIKGWDDGVLGMKVHGKRHLEIPSAMAYGSKDQGKIPPNSDLYFDVELVNVTKAGDEFKIKIEELEPGTGRQVQKGDRATIDYVIARDSGAVVQDSSKDVDPRTGKVLGPLTFTVGDDEQAITALNKAILSMKVGGKYKAIVPGQLGPNKSVEDMKPGKKWIFTIKVLKSEPH